MPFGAFRPFAMHASISSFPIGILLLILYPCYRWQSLSPCVGADCSKVLCTLVYVVPFYVSSSTRPSPTLSRDASSVIRARIRAVTVACIVCSLAVVCLVMYKGNASLSEALRLLGWWPVGPAEIVRSLLLTAILFAGPLFERGVAEGEWKDWVRGSRVAETLGGWIGYRNYVAVSVDRSL